MRIALATGFSIRFSYKTSPSPLCGGFAVVAIRHHFVVTATAQGVQRKIMACGNPGRAPVPHTKRIGLLQSRQEGGLCAFMIFPGSVSAPAPMRGMNAGALQPVTPAEMNVGLCWLALC